jgi:hypothetical protein
MEKKIYFSLIKNIKKILFSKYSNYYTYCISTLYINKGTFDFNEYFKFKDVFSVLNFLFTAKKFFFSFYQFLLSKPTLHNRIKNSNKKNNIFIISNIINKNINKDIYFGDLDKQINKKKDFNCIKIFKNFSSFNENVLWRKLKNNQIILSNKTNFINEIIFIYMCGKEYLRLKFLTTIKKIKIDSNYNYLISLRSLLSMIPTLRLCHQIKKLILIYSPKVIIITFEGHAWERALIKTIKETDKNITAVAYQFSAFNKLNYSIFSNFKKIYSPNIIANSGDTTKNIFKKIYKHKIKCVVLGSCKNRTVKNVKKNNYEILICPENLPNQLKAMLSLTIQLSNYYKNVKFRLRFHPAINSKDRFNYLKKINRKPRNLIISTNSLSKDLTKCSHIIYRGTATVIEALNYGLTPIYLNTYNSELDENPLFYNKKLFFTLNKISDLNNILKSNKNLSKYSDSVKNYFSKFDLNFFNHILLK